MLDLKRYFSRSIGRPGAPLHFAAHSHHPWPDATFEAQQQAWFDAAALLDRKWREIFTGIIPLAQRHVAKQLGLPDPASIVFGPNTHSFLLRILSSLPADAVLNVISTDSEFHSFTRQIDRLVEAGRVNLRRVAAEPFSTFAQRFLAAMRERKDWDLVWFSHVFFNSGWIVPHADVEQIVHAIPERQTTAVVDGYHAFMAIPVDFSRIADRTFYVAGGYKYAMAGEGACFLHCPPGYGMRPRDTGWYAEFGALEAARGNAVAYGTDGSRFAGATFDPSGIYRLNAVMKWLQDLKVGVEEMHAHCVALQEHFLSRYQQLVGIPVQNLLVREKGERGRFLTIQMSDAQRVDEVLASKNIIVDHRGDRLRIGFGIYQDFDDVDRLVQALKAIA